MSKRIVGIVVGFWSVLIIAWAMVLVYDLSSPSGPILAKRVSPPGINDKASMRHSGHTTPFSGG